jgi:S1-C subfamily serine protease
VEAKVVGKDPSADLAVIKVDLPAGQLKPVTMADSSQVKVGQLAIAIGNPFGLSGTMTEGIVSAISRSLPVSTQSSLSSTGGSYTIPDIIQTDAAINPGNSGGVLVNADGQVIGVTTAIRSSTDSNSGIGFVIPSNIVKRIVPSLIARGSYEHPRIGISGTTLTPELAKAMNLDASQKGVLVADVSQGGPAEKAGLQGSTNQVQINGQQAVVGGDVITAIDGQKVNKFDDLTSYLFNNTEVGQQVTLTILRQGKEQTIKLTLGVLN